MTFVHRGTKSPQKGQSSRNDPVATTRRPSRPKWLWPRSKATGRFSNSVAPLGHISMVIYDPHTNGWQVKDVRTLGNYNQDTYHYSSTSAQDAAMTKYWTDTKAAADNGTDIYNAITNS